MTDYPAPGIYDVPEDVYHQMTHISNSDLQLVQRSPAHYYAARLDPDRVEKPPSPALIAGKILHCAILEPEVFDQRYVIVPDGAPNRPQERWRNAKNPSADTVEAFKWWDAWTEANAGREIIKAEDWRSFKAIASAVRSHPEIAGFMAEGEAESTVIATDPDTGLTMRCRTDWMTEFDDTLVVLDVKSTEDARPWAFQRSAWNYGYFHQAVVYKHIISLCTKRLWDKILFLFAAFEKEPPYAVKIYEPSDDALQRSIDGFRRNLETVKVCLERNEWPAYSTDIERLQIPDWVRDDG